MIDGYERIVQELDCFWERIKLGYVYKTYPCLVLDLFSSEIQTTLL